MGGATSTVLTEDILDEYTMLTYLSKSEILNLFKTLDNLMQPQNLQNLNYRFSTEQIEGAFPQLRCNPFRDRIYRVFSSHKDNRLSFEDILDLCSVMSEKCPDKVKAAWAFRIFDFDGDEELGERDLLSVIDRLTEGGKNNLIQMEDKKKIIQVLLDEMDLEKKGNICQLEFQHAVGKMSEFPHSFCFHF